jgi:hypothetical protein
MPITTITFQTYVRKLHFNLLPFFHSDNPLTTRVLWVVRILG